MLYLSEQAGTAERENIMKQEFKGQEVSFTVSEDLTGFAFTAHNVGPETTTQDVNFLGSQFAYSVLGVNNAASTGATKNEDGSITVSYRVA